MTTAVPARRRALFAGALALLASTPAAAQQRVEYEIAFPNAVHHEAEVSATYAGLPAGRPVEVRMSRSSPGRYALHEFAKNVYRVRAVDGRGRALAVTQPDPYGWTVAAPADGTVRFSYTLFGDRVDGTYTAVDATHAHMNMPATFAFVRGMDAAPIRVTFRKPVASWSIATQLFPTADSSTFTAPNLQYFMDSPTEVGPIQWRTWHETAGGRDVTVRIAMHHLGTEAELEAFTAQTRRIVAEEAALFGGMPSDRGVYTFIIDYLPYADGDGMEHRNSTIVTSARPLATGARRNLQTIAHEFFHQWNVERIRPRTLEPFDFERANMSGELWFAEGFTNYFHGVMMRRAGILTDSTWAMAISGAVNTVLTAPGRNVFSAADMSRQAPFVDAAQSIDPQNKANTFISYYTYGEALGLGLDLTLRERYGKSLDDYIRAMWAQHGSHQSAALAPERPYTLADLRRVLGEVSGDTAFARDFFRRHVEGLEPLDYAALLAPAGFALRHARSGVAWFGAGFEDADDGAGIAGTLAGSPAYVAGIDAGDVIVSVGGHAVASVDSAMAQIAAHRPGDELQVGLRSRTGPRTVTVRLTEDPALAVVPVEALGLPLSDSMRALRQAWLASKASH
jgi:predicted metalloprotease with PDZ domain